MNKKQLISIVLTSVLTASFFAVGPTAAREVGARLGISAATSTTTIPLQVRLASSSGTPINGLKTLTFKLYSAPSGGSALWTETWTAGNAVQVTDGVASVLLGSQTALPQSLVANNTTLYLGITVDVEAEMQPRVQLGSAPIAMTVPDGSVTSRKLNLDHGTTCLSAMEVLNMPGGGPSLEVPGLSLTLTLSAPSQVLIWMDGLASFTQATRAEADIILKVDGVGRTASYGKDTDDEWFNVKGQRIVDLDSGTHSITVAAFSINQGMMTVHGSHYFRTCVNYVVLGPT